MKLRIEKSVLSAGLQAVQNVVSSRSTLPILANVLVVAKDNGIYLSTTDLDVSVRCKVEGTIDVQGSTTIPVKRLSSIVRELPDSMLSIESDEKDQTSVMSGSSYFKIVGLSADDFPSIPEADGEFSYLIDQGVFREMLRKTAYAASTDETRYNLNGVMLSFKEAKLTAVATDGRRLALAETEMEFPDASDADMILPSKAVSELMHVLKEAGNLRIYPRKNQVIFSFEGTVLASKLIEGTYPNFRQVIPSQCEERVTLEREALLTALRRASLIIADKSSATKLTFDANNLVILTMTPDVGESRETIPIKYNGKAITVAFNPDYMMDPLKNLSTDEISIELTDNLSPAVIKSDVPFLYVLMPMRVD
ncbi:MAG TPA: DNA polymerase III subunit beta [Verrucomicrobia bacterium]|nr:DNA polymerase III subunit beta [Verrucomicrobiota bacterium]